MGQKDFVEPALEVERQPRERPVTCQRCFSNKTMAFDAICNKCRPVHNDEAARRRVNQ